MTHDRRVVPFRPWHYDWLVEHSPTPGEGRGMKLDAKTRGQLESENSWTGVVDGSPIVCAGTIQHWPGRHQAWAYLSRDTGPHMLWITRQVKRVVDQVKGRVEFTVRSDFEAGQRWAELLGFRIETLWLEKFGPFGEDHVGYVKVN